MRRSFKKVSKSKTFHISKSTIDDVKKMTNLTEKELVYRESNVNDDYECLPDTTNGISENLIKEMFKLNQHVGIQTSSKQDNSTFTIAKHNTKTQSNQGQKKLDTWFRSAITVTKSPVTHQYTEEIFCLGNDTSLSLPEANCSMDKSSLLYNNIPASVKLIPLKPLNMKRKTSDSSDLCLIPITQQNTNKNNTICKKGKRLSDDSFVTPLKKARTVL
ncbi:unnamed protein product [Mytilus coruscus]|uniref:Uncharacterized protein n=1 Tax=Mytilus coruscus TaxID=42192 RepID=A0A6J8BZW5_MYTCO|nr:unnamed protein product [Mytilus coruscus]